MDRIAVVSDGDPRPFLLLVTLTVRTERLDDFRRYEHAAARIMARYGGAIEQALVVARASAPGAAPAADGAVVNEVHFVSFADRAAFEAYRADAELEALAALRAESVISTVIERATRGPRYGA